LFVSDNAVQKGLITLAVEKTLLDIGKPTYDKVTDMLYKDYNCYLPDCYEHPEYLNETLKKLFGNSYHVIVESIYKQLEEFMYKKPVERFLKIISR